jgi:hypothetical protein
LAFSKKIVARREAAGYHSLCSPTRKRSDSKSGRSHRDRPDQDQAMMDLEDKQEQLSLAVLHATCAKAGFAFKILDRIEDKWGWDAEAHVNERLDPASKLTDLSSGSSSRRFASN